MTRFLVFGLLLFLSLRLPAEVAPLPVTDHERLRDHYAQVLLRPEFKAEDQPDLRDTFHDWLTRWLTAFNQQWDHNPYSGEIHGVATLFMVFMLLLVFFGLVYLALKLVRWTRSSWPEMEEALPEKKTVPPAENEDRGIAAALATGNWHAAWLALWRQFLARMVVAQWVEADPTLTNREYLAQLRGKSLPAEAEAELRALVDTYDRTIYGRSPLAEADWLAFSAQVNQASRQLGLHRAPRKAGS